MGNESKEQFWDTGKHPITGFRSKYSVMAHHNKINNKKRMLELIETRKQNEQK